MRDKIIGTVCLVLGIIIIVSTGTSFAYFSSSSDTTGDNITGTTSDFDIDLKIDEVYKAKRLIPLDDSKINLAIANKCVDKRGYEVCSLYKITLTNNGDPQILNASITDITSEEDNGYITDHLKGQLFNNNLTSSESNILTLTNIEGKNYFHIDDTNLFSTQIVAQHTLYLAVWLTETGTYQNDDYSKKYTGELVFESLGGAEIKASFNS